MSSSLDIPDVSLFDSDFEEDPLRSPRTPTYVPSSPSFAQLSPFDPSRRFSFSLSPKSPSKSVFGTANKRKNALPPPPQKPLPWIWQCHLCHSRWPLGATRRCLLDGHLYCSGDTHQPNLKKKKKGQSCSSEFDYAGWRDWNNWRWKVHKAMGSPTLPEGCETCEFPSQCRYSKAASVVPSISDPGKVLVKNAQNTPSASRPAKDDVPQASQDVLSRYYSGGGTGASLEELVARALAERERSKMTDSYNRDKNTSEASSSSSHPFKYTRSKKTGTKDTASLAAVQEESSDGVAAASRDLVMPIMERWGSGKRANR